MARKPKHEERENHDRWLVSYADFITLLFAFFVVMYSISSVNEGKYRVLSSALVNAFSHPRKNIEPIRYGTPLRVPLIQQDIMDQEQSAVSRLRIGQQIMPTAGEMAGMQKLADQLEYNLKAMINEGLISLTKTNLGLEIEIKSKVLFASGMATLSQQAISPLKKIAAILSKTPNYINVEGYTDDVPISTPGFPSNWELSAARAASVVRLFTQTGVEPSHLKAIGFAEFRPVADNSTEQGRSKNRRVTIVVLNKAEEKRVNLDLESKSLAKPDAASKMKIIDTHFPSISPLGDTNSIPSAGTNSANTNETGKSNAINSPLSNLKQAAPTKRNP